MRTTPEALLEVVSQLAGESPTDRPRCVHPTLGAIARAVHDHSSEAGRAELPALAPRLIGTALPGIDTSARLVAICASTALSCPRPHHTTAHENRQLVAARQTALRLLRGRSVGYAIAAVGTAEPEPRLCGAARWWVPLLGPVGLSERFYRGVVAGGQAAAAVAVVARASGAASAAERDRRLRQLLRMCITVTPADGSAPAPRQDDPEAAERRGDG